MGRMAYTGTQGSLRPVQERRMLYPRQAVLSRSLLGLSLDRCRDWRAIRIGHLDLRRVRNAARPGPDPAIIQASVTWRA